MSRSERASAASLNNRIDQLCDAIITSNTAMASAAAEIPNPNNSEAAQTELTIKQHAEAMTRAVQDLMGVCRELQQLWLFGYLDTLADESEKVRSEKLLGLVELCQDLAKKAGTTTGGAETVDEGGKTTEIKKEKGMASDGD